MKDLIKKLVEQTLNELEQSQEPTVYFDMDGVLANFQGAIDKDETYNKARAEFERLAKKHMPDLLDYHTDELKNVFKGRQEDPIKAKLKKLWNQRRAASFTIAGKSGYFRSLEPLPGAREMMKYATKLLKKRPHILTAPMESVSDCKQQKREWVDEHVAGLFDEFHCTQNKDHFAKSKFDILIDDRPKYVDKFRAAGGTAILHTDPALSMKELTKIVDDLLSGDRSLEEISAISAGGASMQSSGQVSGAGGNPLGRDMSDQHDAMWSGDEPEKKSKKARSLKEEFLEEEDLDEFNAVGTGAVAGYTLPLGMAPSHKSSKKKKRPKRWYDVKKESKSRRDLEEQVKTYSGANWAHVPVDGMDEDSIKSFKKLYNVWVADNKELHFNPEGLVKDAVEGEARGMWQPGSSGPLAVNFKKKEIDVRTNLRDPRIAIALKTSLPWFPQLADFDVVKIHDPYNDEKDEFGKLKDLLEKAKLSKVKSKHWSSGRRSDAGPEYSDFEQLVFQEVSDHSWFHATKLKYLSSIMKRGLLPSKTEEALGGWSSGWNMDMQKGVYLTSSEDYASQIAETLLGESGGDEPAVILKISGDALQDPSKLIIDEDAIRDSAFGGQVAPGKIETGMPDYLTSAIHSIESIGYEDVIRPEFISVFEVAVAEFEHDEEGEILDAETIFLTWDEWQKRTKLKKEERIGSRGSVQYFQMGSSLPDELYNRTDDGKPTRDPGLTGETDKKKSKKK